MQNCSACKSFLLVIICDDGGARKPFLLSLDKHENILTMSGTSRQLPGTGERNLQLPASSSQLLNIWMWEHSLNPISLKEHKTDRYLPLSWHPKTSPAGGGKAIVSPAQCATVSCLPPLAFVKCAAAGV